MERVLDVYKKSFNEDRPVVCMDESPKQLIKETRSAIAMRRGQEAREDFEYERCGVVNVFLASEPLTGKRFVEITEKKTKVDWARFIKQIADEWYKDATKITLVWIIWEPINQVHYMSYLNQRKQKGYGTDLILFIPLNMEVG